jgi:hypothetical protein
LTIPRFRIRVKEIVKSLIISPERALALAQGNAL